jgi:hypothetical protein
VTGAKVDLTELVMAHEMASVGAGFSTQVYLSRSTGRTYVVSNDLGLEEDVPDDIEESDDYIPLPDKKELGLGRDLVFAFIAERLPEECGEVRRIFGKRGAYTRYKDLLASQGLLDDWHRFEEAATLQALREWCEENSIALSRPDDGGTAIEPA